MDQDQLPGTGFKQVQLAAVREIFRATAAALPLSEILPIIANVTIIAFDARSVWLMLVADGELRTQVARGALADRLALTACQLGAGAVGAAALGTVPLTLQLGAIDPADPVLGPFVGHAEPVVLVPIVAAGRCLGLLGASVPLESLQDISFLITLAEQAALVIESARLHGEAQSWRQRLSDALKAQTEQLRLSEERFRIALGNIPVAVCSQDRALRYVWAYNAGNGCDSEAMIGRTDEELQERAEGAAALRAIKERVLATGTGERHELRTLRDGQERVHDLIVEPLHDPEGQIVGVTCAAIDITDRAQLLTTAEAALRARDELTVMLSHDLKNPLTAVLGQAQLMRRRLKSGEIDRARLLRGLGSVEEAAGQMHAILDELLDMARLQAGRTLQLERQAIDLVALVRHVVERIQVWTEHHQLCVTSDLPELTSVCDERRIERVVENLLGNAIKYSPRGGSVTVSVERQERAGRTCAVVAVIDEGMGIPSADLPLIFERFQRGGNTTRRIPGTALGLASARRIVEQHGGTIEVTSVEGQGSTFTICLPLDGV